MGVKKSKSERDWKQWTVSDEEENINLEPHRELGKYMDDEEEPELSQWYSKEYTTIAFNTKHIPDIEVMLESVAMDTAYDKKELYEFEQVGFRTYKRIYTSSFSKLTQDAWKIALLITFIMVFLAVVRILGVLDINLLELIEIVIEFFSEL